MKILLVLLSFLPGLKLAAQNAPGSKQPDYIFFLHNKFLEDQGLQGVHPEYGRTEYKEVIQAFQKEGFTVISEIRPKNTDVSAYAIKVVRQIDSLLKKGIRPSHITVIGTSKGGYIAMAVSGLLKNPEVNFVFIGCCSLSEASDPPEFNFCGHILSIYEKSDAVGRSCVSLKDKSANKVSTFREIELNTGLKHGFLFRASMDWMQPSMQWAKKGS